MILRPLAAMGFDHTVPVEHKTREREGANIRKSLLARACGKPPADQRGGTGGDRTPFFDNEGVTFFQQQIF